MDKYEFYILATFHNNIEKMQQTINEYRNSELEKTDFNIISNINDWSYITRLLEDLKIININNTENTYISLTDISKKWKKNA